MESSNSKSPSTIGSLNMYHTYQFKLSKGGLDSARLFAETDQRSIRVVLDEIAPNRIKRANKLVKEIAIEMNDRTTTLGRYVRHVQSVADRGSDQVLCDHFRELCNRVAARFKQDDMEMPVTPGSPDDIFENASASKPSQIQDDLLLAPGMTQSQLDVAIRMPKEVAVQAEDGSEYIGRPMVAFGYIKTRSAFNIPEEIFDTIAAVSKPKVAGGPISGKSTCFTLFGKKLRLLCTYDGHIARSPLYSFLKPSHFEDIVMIIAYLSGPPERLANLLNLDKVFEIGIPESMRKEENEIQYLETFDFPSLDASVRKRAVYKFTDLPNLPKGTDTFVKLIWQAPKLADFEMGMLRYIEKESEKRKIFEEKANIPKALGKISYGNGVQQASSFITYSKAVYPLISNRSSTLDVRLFTRLFQGVNRTLFFLARLEVHYQNVVKGNILATVGEPGTACLVGFEIASIAREGGNISARAYKDIVWDE